MCIYTYAVPVARIRDSNTIQRVVSTLKTSPRAARREGGERGGHALEREGGLGIDTMSAAGRSPCGLPRIGLGTAVQGPRPDPVRAAVLRAIRLGYRHFDTAAHYATEAPIGEAVAEAVRAGVVASRDEIYVTSKVWCADAHPDRVLPALRKTLRSVSCVLSAPSSSFLHGC